MVKSIFNKQIFFKLKFEMYTYFKVKQNDIFRFVTEGILLTVVSIFGLIGNSMSIIVLTRASGVVRQGGASFSKLLRGLATFDALFLFIAIISFE